MKIWVVIEWDRCGHSDTVLGLFSTKEKAEIYMKQVQARYEAQGGGKDYSREVEEWEVDEFVEEC